MAAGCRPAEEETLNPASLQLYEAQFFGCTPQTCMFRVYSAFQDCLHETLLVVEQYCVRNLNNKAELNNNEEQLRSAARERTQKLRQFLDQRFKRLADRMGSVLVDNCFSIPPNVLLPGDEPHREYTQGLQYVLKLESSLAKLQEDYQAEVYAKQALLAELEEQREVREQLERILQWVGELQAAWVKEGMGSFHDSFRLVMESVKKLQDVVGDICSKALH